MQKKLYKNYDLKTVTILFIFVLFYASMNNLVYANNYLAKKTILIDTVIKGKVVDNNKEPLPGVSIKEVGTNNGVVTNVDGNFSIKVKNATASLEFSFLGFKTQRVNVNGRTSLNVSMADDIASLEEVVVVGYGTQKKINLTGSVSSVNFKDLENTPQSNTLNILSGRVAGLSIVQPGGQPGSDNPEVFIRGVGTLNDASPLVIIDGVQATLADVGRLTPQEIQDISILKDASSAAIYGSRGANGVILVTTKRPGEGKTKLNFNSYFGLQEATYLSDFVESWQYLFLHGEATGSRSPEQLRAIEQLKMGIETDSAANTRWFDELYRLAPISNYNLSINGGNNNVGFQGSLGYLRQDGIMKGTDGERFNLRTNVRAKVSNKINAGINLWAYKSFAGEPFASPETIIDRANKSAATVPIKYSNGNWGVYDPLNNGAIIQNPILSTEIGYTKNEEVKANITTFLEVTPIKNLRARTSFNYTYGNTLIERFNPTYQYPWITGATAFSNLNNQISNNTANLNQFQWQTTLNYNKNFGKNHELSSLVGHEYTSFNNRNFSAVGQNSPTNETPVLNSVVNNINVFGTKNEWRLQSFFGRLNYKFKNRYLLEGNIRIDGSSRFPTENKYGYFPSFSAGWIVSEESFFKSIFETDEIFSSFKLRGGVGKVGNDRIGNYTYLQTINTGNNYNFNGAVTAGGAITSYANTNIKWESTVTKNIGVDLSLLKNKLSITYDLYRRYTNDILFRLPLAPSFGIINQDGAPPILNIGEVSNNGWDLQLSYRDQLKNKLNYNFGFNIAYVKNKLEKLNTREAVGTLGGFANTILREGEPLNSFYGYVYEGLYRTQEDLAKYPPFSTIGLNLGTMRFSDVNQDGKITELDRVVIGNSNTPYTFGINGGASFKGIDLNFLFQGVQGKKIYVYDYGNRPGSAANLNFWKEWWDNRFDADDNPDGPWPSLRRNAQDGNASSSFWLRDASYIRLKNMELGYSIPAAFLKKIKVGSLRLYVAGQNILTFSNLIKQIDPERGTSVGGNLSYPQTKIYSFGINASF